MVRRRRNHIYALKNGDGHWVHDSQAIQGMVGNFFIDLYCTKEVYEPFPLFGFFPVIP